MRRYIVLLFLLISVNLLSKITIDYRGDLAPDVINSKQINGVEYFQVYELNKAFQAYITEDILDQRLKVSLYGKQLIFLIETSYMLYNSQLYNFIYPVILEDEKYYIPITFFSEIVNQVFKDNIHFDTELNKIEADSPVDHTIKRIVVDPGHGGKDPGAIGYSKKIFEKDIVLKIARKLKTQIESNLGIQVLLTRDSDEFVSLRDRTSFANENHADLFVSLHCNAARSKKTNGIEVFFLSTAKTNEARAVEALENSVVYEYEGGQDAVKKYDDLSFILMDMAQSEHLEESSLLAMKLQANMIKTGKGKDRGVKQAGFYVLKGAFMPAVLVEMGFITNQSEEKLLKTGSYQDKLVNAIYEGIKGFKIKYDKMR